MGNKNNFGLCRCNLFTFPNFCKLFESLLLSITSTNGNRPKACFSNTIKPYFSRVCKVFRTENEIRKAKYPIDSRNYRLLVFILRLPRYSLTFGIPWTRPSVHSPVYQWNNCTSNITRILSTILTRKHFDSTRFAYMRFSLSSSHALLEMKCDMQISYEMVSNAHVHQLTVSL